MEGTTMKNWSKARPDTGQRRTLVCIVGAAGLLASGLWLWNTRSANAPRAASKAPGQSRVTYGPPRVSVETRNVAGVHLRVENNGDTSVPHEFTRDIPVERSAQARFPDDGLSGTLTRTRTTEVIATIFDVTKCDEVELAEIADRLDDNYVITNGKHGLEGFPCARPKEVRSYEVEH